MNHDDLHKLARLARLSIPETELPELASRLSKVLALVDQLGQADTRGVEPLAHPLDAVAVLRDDTVTETDQRDRLQAIAPLTENGLYLVPKVID